MHRFISRLAPALLLGAVVACDYDDDTNYSTPTEPTPATPAAQIITSSGDLSAPLTQFRTLLGDPRNGGTVGPSTGGRREVNWDGVPAEFNNADNRFPAAFFNTTVRLGLVMTTPGTGFRNDSSLFGDVDGALRTQFAAFSPNKLFAASNSNIIDVEFQLPGQPTPANVAGFGAVFVDVDVPGRTTLEYFDRSGRRLALVEVPVRTATSAFSLAGARFPDAVVARVRITLGTGTLGAGRLDISAGGSADLVVVDDFLYTEPQPIR
ncbi:MAG: hypothetical protein MUF00_14065 [Gemmatimonadaceae bacterium]|jgi:hypothetical protein|nr:hypothetical protein [Gemmatimonadaceae bacterium]